MNHTGLPLEKIQTSMERDHFMSPTEAKEFGLIDKVLCSPPKTHAHVPPPPPVIINKSAAVVPEACPDEEKK